MTHCVTCGVDISGGGNHSHAATKELGCSKTVCAKTKGAVVIHVVDQDGKNLKDVAVALDGAEKKTSSAGIAKYDPLDEKKAVATLKPLSKKMAETYAPPSTTTRNVTVKNGEIAYVDFTLIKKVTVTPVIKLEYRVALLDRKLADKQHADDKAVAARKIKPPTPTRVYLSITQEPGTPKYTKTSKLTVSGAGKLTFYKKYSDAAGYKDADKFDVSKPIPSADLMGAKPLELFALGATKGKLKLKLEPEDPADPKFHKPKPVEEEMAVVELKMKVHEQDVAAIDGIQIDPDAGSVSDYHTKLKNKKLPDQKALSDDDKLKKGRLLHEQSTGSHGRAKIILEKLDDADWPAHTDSYEITLQSTPGSGFLSIHDKEFDGKTRDPGKITVKDLKKKEQEFWVQGEKAVSRLREGLLDLGLDRPAAVKGDASVDGIAKEQKLRGDAGTFTVVKIKEVKVDYTPVAGTAVAWDAAENKFYINYKADPAGRKIKITAKLSKALKDVTLYFLLAEDKDNRKTANWGINLPGTWNWKSITADVKHKDKSDRKKLLHLSEKTDVNGAASKELTLSRFGGDKFRPACYIDQDAHLAKYVEGHADLQKRKPVLAANDVIVWRKFWYQLIEVTGVANPGVAGAVGQYLRIKSTMKDAAKVTKTLAQATGWNAIYPRYMVKVSGGNANSLVISDLNKNNFFGGTGAEADKPIKVPILICDAQWDSGPDTTAVTTGYVAPGNHNVTKDRLVLKPPLQGGALLVAGKIKYRKPGPGGTWVDQPEVNLTDADLDIDSGRSNLRQVQVKMPAAVATFAAANPGTQIKIVGLRVKGAKGPYLGESFNKKVLAVYEPSDPVDFQNTIAHEIGHGFGQTVRHGQQAAGVPNHPNQYISYDSDGNSTGSHCNKDTNKCVMFQSGPIAGSHNRFCDVCHPYMLVNDMSTFT